MAEIKDNPPNQSKEEVAFKLLYLVAWGENIDLEAWGKADRDPPASCVSHQRAHGLGRAGANEAAFP